MKRALFSLATAILISGCATTGHHKLVAVDYDPGDLQRVEKSKTYHWSLPGASKINPYNNQDVYLELMKSDIDAQLAKKGYKLVSKGGDLEISFLVLYKDGANTQVAAHSHSSVALARGDVHRIEARTEGGRTIESFTPEGTGLGAQFVYNVAGAAPLVQWTATYGNAGEVPEIKLGATRWLTTSVDHVFSEPPDSIKTEGGGGTRTALMALSNMSPSQLLSTLDESAQHGLRASELGRPEVGPGEQLTDRGVVRLRLDDRFEQPGRAERVAGLEEEIGPSVLLEKIHVQLPTLVRRL
jgi:hypothetical protein